MIEGDGQKRQLRVLVVIPYFMPAVGYGGPVRVSFDIARGLVSRGHEVTVATTDVLDERKRASCTEERIEGIRVVRFRNVSNRLAKKMNGYLPFLFIPWLVKNAKRFDVIHCHDFFSVQTVASGLASAAFKVPLVVQPHGSLSSVRRAARFAAIKKCFIGLFLGVLRQARLVIALTQEEKKSIEAIVGNAPKIAVVPNGIDPHPFADVSEIDLHAKFGIPKVSRIIGFVGRISPIKGLDISLRILAKLKDSHAFTFLIIGPDEGEMRKLQKEAQALGIAERVVFVGMLSGEEKLRVMKSCDLFLFTSRDEGLPMTVLEAAALGIPQVLSRECNVPEVEEYGAGYVHPLEDVDTLAGSVASILDEDDLRRRLGGNARRMVRERFDSRKVLDRMENLLTESAAP